MKDFAEQDKSICRSCFHSYVCEQFNEHRDGDNKKCHFHNNHFVPAADVVEVDKVAEMLRIMFNDDCACNYNGNDEWLWEKCKYAETDCPMPTERLGCWKEFVKHFLAKMDGKGEWE